MYPSGRWRGYWEQGFYGRQEMHDLVLKFWQGIVEGQGHDIVGAFTFEGLYDDQGSVTMVKQYLGKHRVMYQGRYDGEGTIYGLWSIADFDSGPFALTPLAAQADPNAAIQTIQANINSSSAE